MISSSEKKTSTIRRISNQPRLSPPLMPHRGRKASTHWSRPITLWPGLKPDRLFTKLEMRSPAMDSAAIFAPIHAPGKGKRLQTAAVPSIEDMTPLQVLCGPKSGLLSNHRAPKSTGRENRSLKHSEAAMGRELQQPRVKRSNISLFHSRIISKLPPFL